MKITVRLYGRYKDIAGTDTVHLDIKKGDTLRDLVNAFVKRFPETEKDKNKIMVAKNKIFTGYETLVSEGDDITLTPPVVSGG